MFASWFINISPNHIVNINFLGKRYFNCIEVIIISIFCSGDFKLEQTLTGNTYIDPCKLTDVHRALQKFVAQRNHASVTDMMNGIHGYNLSEIWEAQIQDDKESVKSYFLPSRTPLLDSGEGIAFNIFSFKLFIVRFVLFPSWTFL